jgi:hypothetical protein
MHGLNPATDLGSMGDQETDGACERQAGVTRSFGSEGQVRVVALWLCSDGREFRVVRWELRGAPRDLYQWVRGRDFPAAVDAVSGADAWIAGVALEQRESTTARWSTVRRQEWEGQDLRSVAARLRGWEAGLLDRAEKLARHVKRL